jgi:hypothetical protein
MTNEQTALVIDGYHTRLEEALEEARNKIADKAPELIDQKKSGFRGPDAGPCIPALSKLESLSDELDKAFNLLANEE